MVLVFQSFKGLARILGSALTDRPDLQIDVMSSLRKLIAQNLDNGKTSACKSCFHISKVNL